MYLLYVQAKLFEGSLPTQENTATHGDKQHQVFQRAKADLDNILSGYILPDPHFQRRLSSTVNRMMKCLKDPALPLLELQVRDDTSQL